MPLLEKHLSVNDSQLPGAGKGLYTRTFIPKGTKIVEYKGKITTWKDVDHKEGSNGYIYYVKRNHVIDASRTRSALARYANDARGLQRIKGLSNNAKYIEEGMKVYIASTKDIPEGSEIFVEYGKEYWDAIRHNIKLDKERSAESERQRKGR
jgi:hypothetical protein